jgi:hypothetical protein
MTAKAKPLYEPDHPARTGWFERRTFLPAVVIVALVVAVVAIPIWLNRTVAESTRSVVQGETVTLEVDDGNTVTVEPIAGWELVDSLPSQLVLRDGEASVSVSVAKPVEDLDRYYSRRTRSLRTVGMQALPGRATTTDNGFAGLTGTLVHNGKVGELSLLANDDAMLQIQSLLPPDRSEQLQPQVTAMVNSARGQ